MLACASELLSRSKAAAAGGLGIVIEVGVELTAGEMGSSGGCAVPITTADVMGVGSRLDVTAAEHTTTECRGRDLSPPTPSLLPRLTQFTSRVT